MPEGSIKCDKCGKENFKNVKYCVECGNEINGDKKRLLLVLKLSALAILCMFVIELLEKISKSFSVTIETVGGNGVFLAGLPTLDGIINWLASGVWIVYCLLLFAYFAFIVMSIVSLVFLIINIVKTKKITSIIFLLIFVSIIILFIGGKSIANSEGTIAKKYVKDKYDINAEVIDVTNDNSHTYIQMKNGDKKFQVILDGKKEILSDNYQLTDVFNGFTTEIGKILGIKETKHIINNEVMIYDYKKIKYNGKNLNDVLRYLYINIKPISFVSIYYDNMDAKNVKLVDLSKYLHTIEICRTSEYMVDYADDLTYDFYFDGIHITYSGSTTIKYHIYIDKTKYKEIGISDAKKLFHYIINDDFEYNNYKLDELKEEYRLKVY